MNNYKKYIKSVNKISVRENIYLISRIFMYWNNNLILNISPNNVDINNMEQIIEILEIFSCIKKIDNNYLNDFYQLNDINKIKFIKRSFKKISKNTIYKKIIQIQKINESLYFKDVYRKIKKITKKRFISKKSYKNKIKML